MKSFLEFISEEYIKTGDIVTAQHPKYKEVTGEVTNHSRKHFEVTHYPKMVNGKNHNSTDNKEVTSHYDRKTGEHIKDE